MTESSKRNTIIDLTKPLNTSFIPYSTGKYTDPPLEFSDWSFLHKEGFRVTRLSMGTQSGTHIDAPAHFLEDGAPLEALDQKEAHNLPARGEIFVFPLRLVGVSGSPCRVIVRVPETKTTGQGFQEYIS